MKRWKAKTWIEEAESQRDMRVGPTEASSSIDDIVRRRQKKEEREGWRIACLLVLRERKEALIMVVGNDTHKWTFFPQLIKPFPAVFWNHLSPMLLCYQLPTNQIASIYPFKYSFVQCFFFSLLYKAVSAVLSTSS